MFHKKGDIVIPKSAAKEEDLLMDLVLESGAEDLKDDGDNWEILTDPSALRNGTGGGEEGRYYA